MDWEKWLKKWKMSSLKINIKYLQMEWKPQEADQNAAWEMYIELLTRVSTQHLDPSHGDESTALNSIYNLFDLSRSIIRKYGKDCIEFTKIAVLVLNQIIRPFTAKWHKEMIAGAFKDKAKNELFRVELNELQENLRKYTKMLADMAGVEDLTDLEKFEV